MAYVFSASTTPQPMHGVALEDEWDLEAAGYFSFEIRYLDAGHRCPILGCFSEKSTADNALVQIQQKRKQLHPNPPRVWRPYITAAAAFGIVVLSVILALSIIYLR